MFGLQGFWLVQTNMGFKKGPREDYCHFQLEGSVLVSEGRVYWAI